MTHTVKSTNPCEKAKSCETISSCGMKRYSGKGLGDSFEALVLIPDILEDALRISAEEELEELHISMDYEPSKVSALCRNSEHTATEEETEVESLGSKDEEWFGSQKEVIAFHGNSPQDENAFEVNFGDAFGSAEEPQSAPVATGRERSRSSSRPRRSMVVKTGLAKNSSGHSTGRPIRRIASNAPPKSKSATAPPRKNHSSAGAPPRKNHSSAAPASRKDHSSTLPPRNNAPAAPSRNNSTAGPPKDPFAAPSTPSQRRRSLGRRGDMACALLDGETKERPKASLSPNPRRRNASRRASGETKERPQSSLSPSTRRRTALRRSSGEEKRSGSGSNTTSTASSRRRGSVPKRDGISKSAHARHQNTSHNAIPATASKGPRSRSMGRRELARQHHSQGCLKVDDASTSHPLLKESSGGLTCRRRRSEVGAGARPSLPLNDRRAASGRALQQQPAVAGDAIVANPSCSTNRPPVQQASPLRGPRKADPRIAGLLQKLRDPSVRDVSHLLTDDDDD